MASRTSSAVLRRTSSSGPKMRTTMASPAPVRTSRILSFRVGLHIAVEPGVAVDHLVTLGQRRIRRDPTAFERHRQKRQAAQAVLDRLRWRERAEKEQAEREPMPAR
jgi:hypothetical protein